MSFVQLYDTVTIKDPGQTPIFNGLGRRDVIDVNNPRNAGDYAVYARFKIIEQDFDKDFLCFRTEGTSTCLSLYSMVQGIYNLTSFGRGAEISEDFDEISSSQVLRLPMDFNIATQYINDNLIGKTLRVVARSAANTTKFGTRYYIFVIEG